MDMSRRKLQETVKDREACHAAVHGVSKVGHNWVTEQQQQKKQSSTTVIKLGLSTIFLALLGTYDYLTFVVIAMVKDEG